MMLISVEELADYLSVEADSINQSHLVLANREVAVLIRSHLTQLPDSVDEWPENAKVVALRVVARGVSQADLSGLSSYQQSAGPFQQSFGVSENVSSGSFYLTKQDKAILNGRKGGAYAVDTLPADTRDNGSPGYRQSEWLWGGTTY